MDKKNFEENNGDRSYPDFEQFPMLNDRNIEKFQSLTTEQPEILKEIMNSFIEESTVLMKDIEKAINESDHEKFQEYVHTLKGLFATIGASRLFEISKFIDDNNKKENFDVARKYFPELKKYFTELQRIIKEKFLQ